MRSLAEIRFRVRQEIANLWMLAFPPRPPAISVPPPLAGLPAPDGVAGALRGTEYATEIQRLAGMILAHEFPIFGTAVHAGPQVRWRRDYAAGIEGGTPYFRRVAYLDARRSGDHKTIWELNRHQHLVLLAQAFRLSGEARYVGELQTQVESWLEDNPWLCGMNWTSALEVAFRALSWTWVYHLAGDAMPAAFRGRFLNGLYRHGCYLEHNLSVYFSPNTHLLGEAVALHILGALFQEFPGAGRWRNLGGDVVREQMRAQVRADGSHFEQSTYYHVYALDFFLLHAAVAETTGEYRDGLARMAEYLAAVMGPDRSLPFFGDDDGGRVFHPYGPRDTFGRATLASCGVLLGRPEWIPCRAELCEQAAWWFGERAPAGAGGSAPAHRSRLFADAGMAIMEGGELRLVVDAGPFGPWSAGHSHSDTLHFTASDGAERLLIDVGTYTYVGDAEWRERFRGSAAHNTVRVDGADQAVQAGPFAWRDLPRPEVLAWDSAKHHDYLDAVCRMGEFRHRRRILLIKPALAVVLDEIEGPDGPHVIEQFWHSGEPARMAAPDCARIGSRAGLWLSEAAGYTQGGMYGWVSPAPGSKSPGPLITVRRRGLLPLRLAAVLGLREPGGAGLSIDVAGQAVRVSFVGGLVTFAASGLPDYRLERG